PEHTAERACPVERSLRPAENLDSIDVERVEVAGENRPIDEAGARPERRFVDINAHGRCDPTRVDAAQDQAALALCRLIELKPGNELQIILEAVSVLSLQGFAGINRYRLRDIEQHLRTLRRRDDDRFRILLA